MNNSEFNEVLDILKIHGHEIMMKLTGNECRETFKRGLGDRFAQKEKDGKLMYYSCYDGMDLIPRVFGNVDFDRRADLDSISPTRIPLAVNQIYHCKLDTGTDEEDYGMEQVHYFTIVYAEAQTILLQTYGGTQGILIKYVHSDINELLSAILHGSAETYRRLFEVPTNMEHILEYENSTLAYVSQPLVYPTLSQLDELVLSHMELDYAKVKSQYLI